MPVLPTQLKRVFDKFPGMTFGPCQLRPESRGSVHIKSPNPLDAPKIPSELSQPLKKIAGFMLQA